MRIGGFQKVSLIDYPGQISSVVFTQGCNFRCPYCHNPELVDPFLYKETQDREAILSFLDMRKGKIDAVTLTGGEPTLQGALALFAVEIKKMGYLIKLDTNGAFPEALKTLVESGLMDYIAMDIKAPLEKYSASTCSDVNAERIRDSIDIIMASGIEYEFRTTVVPSLFSLEDLQAIAGNIKNSNRYVIQRFVPSNNLAPEFIGQKTFSLAEMNNMKETLEKYLPHVMIRY